MQHSRSNARMEREEYYTHLRCCLLDSPQRGKKLVMLSALQEFTSVTSTAGLWHAPQASPTTQDMLCGQVRREEHQSHGQASVHSVGEGVLSTLHY